MPTQLKGKSKTNKKFPDLTGDGKITQADILKGRGVKGFKTGDKVKNTGGSKDLKRGVPKTTDVAGPKKFKNKKGVTKTGRELFQMLEGLKEVPGSGYMTRDPRTGKELPSERVSDLSSKRRKEDLIKSLPSMRKDFSGPKVTMDSSVAAHQDNFKKGGKVKKAKKSSRPKGYGITKQGVRNAKMITMKGS